MARMIDADALTSEIQKYASDPIKLRDRRWDARCRAIIADMIGTVKTMPTIATDASEEEQWFEDWGLTPETANQVLANYSAFLCSMTGGKLSKIGYDLKTMETVANDYWNMLADEELIAYKRSVKGCG